MKKTIINKILNNPEEYAKSINIKDLVVILTELSEKYYNTGVQLVTDEIYDILLEVLKKRSPKNKFLQKTGAKVTHNKIPLPYPMPSLDKIKPEMNALDKWTIKYPGPYSLSDKLDGMSGMIVKDDNNYTLMTKGNETDGKDISHLIPYLFDKDVLEAIPDDMAIRGEIIVSKNIYKKKYSNYKTIRSVAAALVNKKTLNEDLAHDTDFIAYSIVHPRYKHAKQITLLKKIGIPLVNNTIKNKLANDVLTEHLLNRRDKGKYEIDGIVVIDDSKCYTIPKKGKPTFGFAFKTMLQDQIIESTIVKVDWNVSKDGFYKPRVQIVPVKLGSGVTITYATAFNAKYVQKNILGPGAVIKIVRSGDVIPDIVEVIKPAASGKPQMPKEKYKWNKSKVDIIIDGDANPEQQKIIASKQISYFFKKIGAKFISEGTAYKIVNAGYDSVINILKADKKDLAEIGGLGKTVVNKIFKSIDEAFAKITLPSLMGATIYFGSSIGERKIKLAIDKYPNLLTIKKTKGELISMLENIHGYDTITATSIADGLPEFKKFYKQLEKYVNLSNLSKKKIIGTLFKDKSFVFTGFRDKEMEEFIVSNGGTIKSSVSKNTSVVIYADTEGSKYKKAEDLGIKLVDVDVFRKKHKLIK